MTDISLEFFPFSTTPVVSPCTLHYLAFRERELKFYLKKINEDAHSRSMLCLIWIVRIEYAVWSLCARYIHFCCSFVVLYYHSTASSWWFSLELQNISTCLVDKMAQRCGGRVCPSHIHVGQGLQETRNNVPTTEKEKKPVSGANYTQECSTNRFS